MDEKADFWRHLIFYLTSNFTGPQTSETKEIRCLI